MIGTWCTEEIKFAVERGYTVLEIYEVHHCKEKSRNLFQSYIDTFMKIKQEASGFPDDVKTPEEITQYITKYLKEEGIQLNLVLLNPKI